MRTITPSTASPMASRTLSIIGLGGSGVEADAGGETGVTLNKSIGKPESPVRPVVVLEPVEELSDGKPVGVDELGLSGERPVIAKDE